MIMIIISYRITRRLNHALYLDAWLERSDPRLRLLDAETGQEILRCSAAWIIPLLESGELSLEDIQDKGL